MSKEVIGPKIKQFRKSKGLTQEQLAHTLFPLGNLHKTQIRDIAKENGFINADKPDSQDICFVPDGNYVKAIEKFSENKIKEGNFIDKSGKVIGFNHIILLLH